MSAEAIRFTVLVLLMLFIAVRVPGAVRGRNTAVFASLVLMFVAVALSLEVFYQLVDGWLGGRNYANLLLRFLVYAVLAILGARVAAAFRAPRATRLILGPIGILVLTVTAVMTWFFFATSDLPVSSAGLAAYLDQGSVSWYANVGRLYPGYVGTCLIVPALRNAVSAGNPLLARIGSALLSGGFAILTVYVVLRLPPLSIGIWDVVLPFGVIALVSGGLTLFWLSHHRARRTAVRNGLADR